MRSSDLYNHPGVVNPVHNWDNYQPLDAPYSAVNEDEKHKNGLWSSVFSLICTTVGAGILSMPSGMVPIGWLGLSILFIVAGTCIVTCRYLVECQFAVPGKIMKTYEEIGEAAFPRYGRPIVAIVQLITLIGVPAIFLILIGGNMNALLPQLTTHVWAFIFAGVMIPIAWIKTMKEISLLAYLGVFASIFVALLIIIRGIEIMVNGDEFTNVPGLPSGTTVTAHHSTDVFLGSGLAQAINIFVFGFGGQSVIPNIVSEMRDAKRIYKSFAFWSYLIIGIVYSAVAAFGYAAWGADCQSNILNNITGVDPDGNSVGDPPKVIFTFGQISRAIIVVHLITAYPILLNPVSLYFEELFKIESLPSAQATPRRLVIRTGLVLFTLALASAVPFFGDFLQLVSALSLIVVAFIFPPIFYYVIFKPVRSFPWWEKLSMLVICLGGIASSGCGVYFAIKGLTDDIEHQSPFSHYFKD